MTGKIMKIDIIEDKITQKGLRIELQVLLDLEAWKNYIKQLEN